jgi:hypothetical protein
MGLAVMAWGSQAPQKGDISLPRAWYARNLGKIIFFLKIVLSCLQTRQCGYKKRNFLGVELGERGPRNYFWTALAKAA